MARVQTAQRLVGQVRQSQFPVTISGIWTAFWAEPWSFKFTCIYIFLDYVRPQEVYEALKILPWAQLTLVGACASFVLEGRRVISRTPANWLLAALGVLVLLSSVLAFSPDDSFDKINVVVSWLVLFFLMANTSTDQRKFYLMIVLFLVWSTKMSQHGARAFVTGSGAAGGAPGYFQNTGEFALQMCIYVPLALFFISGLKPHLSKPKILLLSLLPVAGVLGILNSGSRGGYLGIAAVGLWMLFRSEHKARLLAALSVIVPLMWVLTPEYQKERFRTAGDDETSVSRLVYWKRGVEMANSHPFFGVGYENWIPYYKAVYPPKNGEPVKWLAPGVYAIEVSHNIFIEVLSQLGYTGLVLFSSILAYIWILNRRTRLLLKHLGERGRFLREISYGVDAGVVGFIVAGFFMAVAFYPFVWVQLGLAGALHSAALRTIVSPAESVQRAPRSRRPKPLWGLRDRRVETASVRL